MAQTVIDAASFINLLGVNVQLYSAGTPYEDVTAVENALNYLGLTNMRDLGAQNNSAYVTLANAGYHFDFLVPGGGPVNLDADMRWFHDFEAGHPGSIVALEGPNEVNNWPVSYNSQTGYPAAVSVQNALFQAVNADPTLSNIPVVNLSLGVDNSAAYAPLGDLSGAADYGNVHLYTPNGAQPGATFQHYLSIGRTDTPGLSMRVTETGYQTAPSAASGVDDAAQAKLTLNMLLDSAKFGISSTYLYQLADTSSSDHWGLFNRDWSAKPAATAIHDLTQILSSDPGSITPTAAAPAYRLADANPDDSSLVFHERSGTYDIVVWSEPQIWDSSSDSEVAAAPHKLTLDLSQAVGGYSIYDPLTGPTAVSTSNSPAQAIALDVTDHPLVVELHGAAGSAGGESLVGGAANDTMAGATGGDTLFGGAGDDSIVGGAGFDQVNGNSGDDTIVGRSTFGDLLQGGQGQDLIDASASTGNNLLNGDLGDDTLVGGSGLDTLRGGRGDDVIHAGSGDDWISGDLGNNIVYGGQGADSFHAGAGHDVVNGWRDGDLVQVDPGLTWAVSQVNADVHVAFSNGGEMDLIGIQLSALQSGWIVSA
jgi:hypothetical protein